MSHPALVREHRNLFAGNRETRRARARRFLAALAPWALGVAAYLLEKHKCKPGTK